MAAVRNHDPDANSPRSSTGRARAGISRQSVLLLAAGSAVLLAVAAGVVLACLVFPRPTMWRVAIIGLVIVGAALPVRALVGRRARRMVRPFAVEAEAEL